MQPHEQVQFLEAVGEFVRVQIAHAVEIATAPLLQKIDALQFAIENIPAGKDGKDGRDGIDGQNGQPGADGLSVDLDSFNAAIADAVQAAVSGIPVPAAAVSVVGGYIDRDGNLCLTFSDGSIKALGTVVGRDGKDVDPQIVVGTIEKILASWDKPKDGKDGKDGLGFDDLKVYQLPDDERMVVFKFIRGEQEKEFQLYFPHPIYIDIWRAGEYRRGDCVTLEGSMFMATSLTDSKPGTPGCDWKLIVKRGREGERGKPGKDGKDGTPGRDGRDLTQLGFDGRKY
jgi:hypothetical protein